MSSLACVQNYFKSSGFRKWCNEIDVCVEEDFIAMIDVLRSNLAAGDSYAAQMQKMGFCFEKGRESAAKFVDCLQYIAVGQPLVENEFCFQPVKVFRKKNLEKNSDRKSFENYFVANLQTGNNIEYFDDETLEKLNLLKPDIFVNLLASGLFPIGCPTREQTNQTLSAHDLAHLAGFLVAPQYAHQMLGFFKRVFHIAYGNLHGKNIVQPNEEVAKSLENFDSYYSLRLYYLVEVLVQVRNVALLEAVLGHKVTDFTFQNAKKNLKIMLQNMGVVERIRYMRKICEEFHNIIEPLGGESRDIFNRQRKQKRAAFTVETRNSLYSAANSKFAQNSMYSLYYDVKEAIKECRSSHANYLETVCELFSTFLAALVGTAKLSVQDWIDGSNSPVPLPETKLYQYVDGLFDRERLFWKAFCAADFETIAK